MKDYKNTPEGKRTAIKYADIIHMNRPASTRPKMDLIQRAKIFSPYDALRGFDEAIDSANERNRRVHKILLSDEQKSLLSDKLLQLRKGMLISVKYFDADSDGLGTYRTVKGTVLKIDSVRRTLAIKEASPDTAGGKFEKILPTVIQFSDLIAISLSDIS